MQALLLTTTTCLSICGRWCLCRRSGVLCRYGCAQREHDNGKAVQAQGSLVPHADNGWLSGVSRLCNVWMAMAMVMVMVMAMVMLSGQKLRVQLRMVRRCAAAAELRSSSRGTGAPPAWLMKFWLLLEIALSAPFDARPTNNRDCSQFSHPLVRRNFGSLTFREFVFGIHWSSNSSAVIRRCLWTAAAAAAGWKRERCDKLDPIKMWPRQKACMGAWRESRRDQ